MTQQILQVTGMHCGGCAASVERALNALSGVLAVTVDLTAGRVTVDSQEPMPLAQLADAVRAAGFEVEG